MDGWSLDVSYLIKLRIRPNIRLIHPNVPLRWDIILLGYLPSRPGTTTGSFFITSKYCRRSTSILPSGRLYACKFTSRRDKAEIEATILVSRFGQPQVAAAGMAIAGISMLMASFSTNNIGGLVFLQGILFGLSGSLIYLVRIFIPLWQGKIHGLTSRRLIPRPVIGLRRNEDSALVLRLVEVDWAERPLLS